jgi:hypothetical protein
MPATPPRDPRAQAPEPAPEARQDDDLRDLLRETRRHLRDRGPVHPRRAPVRATPRRRPDAGTATPELATLPAAAPTAHARPLPSVRQDDPAYVAWTAAVVGTLFATGLVVGLVTLWFLPVQPRATGFAHAWPWGLVSIGALAAGFSILTTAWPRRSDEVPSWTTPVSGGLAAMLLSIGLLGILWFLRVLTAG